MQWETKKTEHLLQTNNKKWLFNKMKYHFSVEH